MKNAFLVSILAFFATASFAAGITNGRTFHEVIIQGQPNQTVSVTLLNSFETDDSCNIFSLEGQAVSAGQVVVADVYVSQTKMLCQTHEAQPHKVTVKKPLELLLNSRGFVRVLVPAGIEATLTP